MEKKPQPIRFVGDWKPRTFDGSLRLEERNAGQFHLVVDGEDLGGPLELNDKWRNLKSEEACLSLHGGSGRLFGIYWDKGGYQTFAAYRERSLEMPGPACGQDSPIFNTMLRPEGFRLKTLRIDGLSAPADVEDLIAIRRADENSDYFIGKIEDGVFLAFDQLCPDAANGNLNSRPLPIRATMRSVTMWQMPDAKTLFSMVAIPREAAAKARDLGGSDPAELARGLGLLPFELALLKDLPPHTPGDPLIIWGADDGGG
jgi:hypothetical protein